MLLASFSQETDLDVATIRATGRALPTKAFASLVTCFLIYKLLDYCNHIFRVAYTRLIIYNYQPNPYI